MAEAKTLQKINIYCGIAFVSIYHPSDGGYIVQTHFAAHMRNDNLCMSCDFIMLFDIFLVFFVVCFVCGQSKIN